MNNLLHRFQQVVFRKYSDANLDRHDTDKSGLPQLSHFSYTDFFNNWELEQLAKRKKWLEMLERGDVEPTNEKQRNFVGVCRGELRPEKDYEFLWIRYRAVVREDNRVSALCHKIDDLESSLAQTIALRKTIFEQIEITKNQELLIKKLQNKLVGYEKRLGVYSSITTPPKENMQREICSACGGDGGISGQCYKCDGTGWFYG